MDCCGNWSLEDHLEACVTLFYAACPASYTTNTATICNSGFMNIDRKPSKLTTRPTFGKLHPTYFPLKWSNIRNSLELQGIKIVKQKYTMWLATTPVVSSSNKCKNLLFVELHNLGALKKKWSREESAEWKEFKRRPESNLSSINSWSKPGLRDLPCKSGPYCAKAKHKCGHQKACLSSINDMRFVLMSVHQWNTGPSASKYKYNLVSSLYCDKTIQRAFVRSSYEQWTKTLFVSQE